MLHLVKFNDPSVNVDHCGTPSSKWHEISLKLGECYNHPFSKI